LAKFGFNRPRLGPFCSEIGLCEDCSSSTNFASSTYFEAEFDLDEPYVRFEGRKLRTDKDGVLGFVLVEEHLCFASQ
jgi:hypothetical protein